MTSDPDFIICSAAAITRSGVMPVRHRKSPGAHRR
jgi:hypothetical protein